MFNVSADGGIDRFPKNSRVEACVGSTLVGSAAPPGMCLHREQELLMPEA